MSQASDMPSSPLPARQAGPVGGWPLMLSGAVAGAGLQLPQPVFWAARAHAVRGPPAGGGGPGGVGGAAVASAAALAVFALTGRRASHFAAGALNPALEGRDILVTGVVGAMPQPMDAGLRLRLAVESASLAGAPVQLPAWIDLGWY